MKSKKNYKNQATELQRKFAEENGIVFENYCILKDEDALQNQLYSWPNIIDGIEKLKNIIVKSSDGKVKNVFKNMLRSEHIPYNLFMPLFLSKNQESVLLFYKKLIVRDDLLRVKNFNIEWAPKPSQNYLEDNTSFDTYIEFEIPNNKTLGVGIEVKFTEKSYPFAVTEKERLQSEDDSSPYYKVWSNPNISIYKEETYSDLGTKELKQFFRNHLLGLSMMRENKINEFISVHLFPSGNEYQDTKSKEYLKNLKDKNKDSFNPITFEEFIAHGRNIFKEEEFTNWLNYLEKRYIV